jgi:spermidine synthase
MKRDNATLAIVLVCFFLSGLAALLYQTVWMRYFSIVFGTSELAVVTVLVAYMGGLALGAAVIGRSVDRLQRPVLVYALLELGIAASAALVPWGLWSVRSLYIAVAGGLEELPGSMGIGQGLFYLSAGFLVLMIPTGFMGATLPLLAKGVVHTQAQIGRRVGLLYATNTLGAICGTLCAAFALVPALGLRLTAGTGIVLNVLAGLLGLAVAKSMRAGVVGNDPSMTTVESGAAPTQATPQRSVRRKGKRRKGEPVRNDRSRTRESMKSEVSGLPLPTGDMRAGLVCVVFPLMMFSGSLSFAYEVLWTRLLGHVIGGSMTAFATMLASFLLGIALGSMVASRLATTAVNSARGLAVAQLGIGLLSTAVYFLLAWIPEWTATFRAQGWSTMSWTAMSSILVLLPSTLCIGATFPFAVRIVARRAEEAAEVSARVYAWNTVGAILGAFLAGFFLIPGLGFSGMIKLAVVGNFLLALMALYLVERRTRVLMTGAVCLLAFGIFFRPGIPIEILLANRLLEGKTKASAPPLLYYDVGRSATVMAQRHLGNYELRTNGLPEANIQLEGSLTGPRDTVYWMGILPSLMNLDAESALIVGFGSGQVINGVPPQIKTIDVVELEEKVIEANEQLAAGRHKDPLADPRVRVTINDARGALALTKKKFDVAISQPSHPWTAGASHLYTREFMQQVHDHLNPDGVFLQWMGLRFLDQALAKSLLATVHDVFGSVRVFEVDKSLLIVASNGQMNTIADWLAEAKQDGSILHRTDWLPLQYVEDVAAAMVLDEEGVARFVEGAPLSTDDHNLMAIDSPKLIDQIELSLEADQQHIWRHDDVFLQNDRLARLGTDPGWSHAHLLWKIKMYHGESRHAAVLAALPEPDAAFVRGFDAIFNGDAKTALAEFNKVLGEQPDNAEARLYAAYALMLQIPSLRDRTDLFIEVSEGEKLSPAEVQFGALAAGLRDEDRHILEAFHLSTRSDWDRFRQLDPQLESAISVRHGPLFAHLADLRVAAWVGESTGAWPRDRRVAGGQKALQIVESMLSSGLYNNELLEYRAIAAAIAGNDAKFADTIWLFYRMAEADETARSAADLAKTDKTVRYLLSTCVPPRESSRSPVIRDLFDSLQSEGILEQ